MSPQYINVKFELVQIGRRQTKKVKGLLAHLSFLLFLYNLINFGGYLYFSWAD